MVASSGTSPLPPAVSASIEKINDLITTDAGGRGMKHLVVPGDLLEAATILARLQSRHVTEPPHVIILTGFPCCVDESPPMETDGLAIGDGGNELGMGKVIGKIHEHIPNGEKIGAVTPADHLIAASVSNWGAYALIAAAALVRYNDNSSSSLGDKKEWIDTVLPTEDAETKLIHRCVAAGCRDGISGKMEATVDGMPLERSMECLREIRKAALGEQ